MASTLLRCRACRQPVLDDARCCPHCAVAAPVAPQAALFWFATTALAAVLAAFVAGQVVSPGAKVSSAPSAPPAEWPAGDRVAAGGLRACERIEDIRRAPSACLLLPAGTRVREVAQASYSADSLACLSAEGRDACLWVALPPRR